jgi:hypothetical protein
MKYLEEERKAILFEIDSILRWDKINLSWWRIVAWQFIRWSVIKLTNI